jgi:hypothetical protein
LNEVLVYETKKEIEENLEALPLALKLNATETISSTAECTKWNGAIAIS